MPRKIPFSSKQKKKQLQERRLKKQGGANYVQDSDKSDEEQGAEICSGIKDDTHAELKQYEQDVGDSKHNVLKVNVQPNVKSQERYNPNRYKLHFFKETRHDMIRKKEQARHPYTALPQESLETDFGIRAENFIDIPKRPAWDYSLSKNQLEKNEEKYFQRYLDNLFRDHSTDDLSYVELNLETWRQLWRVLEMSDIFLIITDIRYPATHFPPALYTYITEELKKPVVIVLNKVDLAPPSVVVAWQHYFKLRFPLIDVVCFSSFPKSKEEMEFTSDKTGKVVFRKRRRGTYRTLGPNELLHVCQKLVPCNVDLSSWQLKIEEDQGFDAGVYDSDNDGDDDENKGQQNRQDHEESCHGQQEKVRDGTFTIGCVGYPNVGKSSVINGLMGKKVVSVSHTPGHTKHFQTICLTPSVKLCDCPGLVFPSKADRHLQILGGIYPISQVRDPYSTIGYLAERLNLPKLLRIKPLDATVDQQTYKWSAIDICEAWAEKRGFLTAKAGRLDSYRSANNLLRMALAGRICLCLYPKGYVKNKGFWLSHDDTTAFIDLQHQYRQKAQASAESDEEVSNSSSTEADLEEVVTSENSPKGTRSEPFTSANPFALLGEEC